MKVIKDDKRIYNLLPFIGQKLVTEQVLYKNVLKPITKIQLSKCDVINCGIYEELIYVELGIKKDKQKSKQSKYIFSKGFWFKKNILSDSKILLLMEKKEINLLDLIDENQISNITITAKSKGKGFEGGMKKHGFAGGNRSHGSSLFHRRIGAVGQECVGKIFKQKKMPGKTLPKTVTIQNNIFYSIDKDKQIISLIGLVPGCYKNKVVLRLKLI